MPPLWQGINGLGLIIQEVQIACACSVLEWCLVLEWCNMGPAQVCPFSGEQKRRWVRWPDSRRGEVELHLVRSPCFVAYTSSVPSGASNFGLSTKVKRFPFVQMIDGLFTFRASLAELRFLRRSSSEWVVRLLDGLEKQLRAIEFVASLGEEDILNLLLIQTVDLVLIVAYPLLHGLDAH